MATTNETDFDASVVAGNSTSDLLDVMTMEELSTVERFVLASSISMVVLIFIILPACYFHCRHRRILSQQRHRRWGGGDVNGTLSSSSIPEDDARKFEQRYRTIEAWLVSKKVHAHDEVCGVLMGSSSDVPPVQKQPPSQQMQSSNSSSSSSSSSQGLDSDGWGSISEESGDDHECSICFEPFKVGEIVSWSANPKCDHIFHHVCIKDWLLTRKDCPFCRSTYLPIDAIEGELSVSKIPELILGQNLRMVKCFYCLDHRAVFLPTSRQLPCSIEDSVEDRKKKDLASRLMARASATPERQELSEMRGSCIVDPADEESSTRGGGPSVVADEEQQQRRATTTRHNSTQLHHHENNVILDDPSINSDSCLTCSYVTSSSSINNREQHAVPELVGGGINWSNMEIDIDVELGTIGLGNSSVGMGNDDTGSFSCEEPGKLCDGDSITDTSNHGAEISHNNDNIVDEDPLLSGPRQTQPNTAGSSTGTSPPDGVDTIKIDDDDNNK